MIEDQTLPLTISSPDWILSCDIHVRTTLPSKVSCIISKSVGKVAGGGHVSRTSHSLTHCRALFVLAFVSAHTLRGFHAGIEEASMLHDPDRAKAEYYFCLGHVTI